jgi:hypothetical protein
VLRARCRGQAARPTSERPKSKGRLLEHRKALASLSAQLPMSRVGRHLATKPTWPPPQPQQKRAGVAHSAQTAANERPPSFPDALERLDVNRIEALRFSAVTPKSAHVWQKQGKRRRRRANHGPRQSAKCLVRKGGEQCPAPSAYLIALFAVLPTYRYLKSGRNKKLT